MKVGGDIEDDIKRASTIRKIIGYDNDLVWEITQMSTVVNIHWLVIGLVQLMGGWLTSCLAAWLGD